MTALDNPAWWALTGRQRALGRATPLAARFDPEVSPFGAIETSVTSPPPAASANCSAISTP